MGTHSRHVKFGGKIPICFGKIATKPHGGYFLTHTVVNCLHRCLGVWDLFCDTDKKQVYVSTSPCEAAVGIDFSTPFYVIGFCVASLQSLAAGIYCNLGN